MVLARYARRFGGEGTIVTLGDGRAFTAAHCLAAVDGRRGALVASAGCVWRVIKRWSPDGCDLALLAAVASDDGRRARRETRGVRGAGTGMLHVGGPLEFYGYAAGRFRARRAVVRSVTSTRAVADVLSHAGVRSGDSGGPVLVDGRLVGIVVARSGQELPSGGSRGLEITRLDSQLMRRRIATVSRRYG